MKSKLTGLAAGTVSGNPSAGELIKTYPHQTPDESTTIGPIARGDFRDGVHDQVVRSIASGAELLLGGNKIGGFKSEAQQGVIERKLRLSKQLRAYVRTPRMANEMHG
jgi:hypothetical protein